MRPELPARRAWRLLSGALHDPRSVLALALDDWDLLLRVARGQRLLGRVAVDLTQAGLLAAVPPRAAAQLRAAHNLIRHRQTVLTWELDRVLWALADLEVPVIALKGTAYVIADLPPARGRFYADLDLLVPFARITAVEQRLLDRGWLRLPLDPYDERYYRQWMHELPPLRHRERPNEIDLHHHIVPRTSRYRPDAELLFAAARPVLGHKAFIFAPHDLVLHAVVHLVLEGEPHEGLRLRDLIDIAELCAHFGTHEPDFWPGLVPRARALHLERPLYYALRCVERLRGGAIPDDVRAAVAAFAPPAPLRAVLDWAMTLALLPEHPDHRRARAALARWLLYARAHWLRMPPLLLARHLGYKAWLRLRRVPRPRPTLGPREVQRL